MVFIQESAPEKLPAKWKTFHLSAEELDWSVRHGSSYISLQAAHWLSLNQLNLTEMRLTAPHNASLRPIKKSIAEYFM